MRGFTLIELMIVMCIVGILGVLIFGDHSNKTVDVNGMPQQVQVVQEDFKCISGFRFVDGKQIINETGSGIPCE